MDFLKRKIDNFLIEWKNTANKMPLIIKGSRQIGKTSSILSFAKEHYQQVVDINFVLQKKFRDIFADGYDVEQIIKNISIMHPAFKFVPGKTLIFFDEIQACPDCATSLKSFKIDGRFDVICSGSLMGLHYHEIESNSVGFKEDYDMHALDFEEFLWAKGYSEAQIDDLLAHMVEVRPFSTTELETLFSLFRDYMTLGGMPAVVNSYIRNGHFGGTLKLQQQLLLDYEEDITKYAVGLDKGKVLNIYHHISTFLAQENKKFQISKIGSNARNRDYIGTVDWLNDAGIVNICYCLEHVSLPLKGNYNPKFYKLYYRDTGLLVASLDEEAQEDLRVNKNFGTYKGALYENIVGDMLVKQGYKLYYYRDEKATMEMDFFLRDKQSLVPVEVKAGDKASKSLNKLLAPKKFPDIRYGIKLGYKNIGFNDSFYTFPYFLTFLMKRFLREQ